MCSPFNYCKYTISARLLSSSVSEVSVAAGDSGQSLNVAVAMSGGIDSSVAALLLKKKGYNVIGIHMMNWDTADEAGSGCAATKDREHAREVCDRLNIDLVEVSFAREYWNEVFTPFLDSYETGKLACNYTSSDHMLHLGLVC